MSDVRFSILTRAGVVLGHGLELEDAHRVLIARGAHPDGAWATLENMQPHLLALSTHVFRDADARVRAEYPSPDRGVHVTHGLGGWTIYYASKHNQSGQLSGYGEDWREHLSMLEAGAVYVDLRTIPTAELVHFAYAGPMSRDGIPQGYRDTWGGLVRLNYRLQYGGARALDYVSHEDRAAMALELGARVGSAHELARQPAPEPIFSAPLVSHV